MHWDVLFLTNSTSHAFRLGGDQKRVMIHISDRAGGIPFDATQRIWSYLYSTAKDTRNPKRTCRWEKLRIFEDQLVFENQRCVSVFIWCDKMTDNRYSVLSRFYGLFELQRQRRHSVDCCELRKDKAFWRVMALAFQYPVPSSKNFDPCKQTSWQYTFGLIKIESPHGCRPTHPTHPRSLCQLFGRIIEPGVFAGIWDPCLCFLPTAAPWASRDGTGQRSPGGTAQPQRHVRLTYVDSCALQLLSQSKLWW